MWPRQLQLAACIVGDRPLMLTRSAAKEAQDALATEPPTEPQIGVVKQHARLADHDGDTTKKFALRASLSNTYPLISGPRLELRGALAHAAGLTKCAQLTEELSALWSPQEATLWQMAERARAVLCEHAASPGVATAADDSGVRHMRCSRGIC